MGYKCDECDSTFREMKNLQQHRRKQHGLKNISVIIVITIPMIEAMYWNMKNPNMEMNYLNASNVIIPTLEKIFWNVILDPNILISLSNAKNVILSLIEKIN